MNTQPVVRKKSYRCIQIGELIKNKVAQLIQQLRDPRLGFITVYEVKVSPDLRQAKVYISVMEQEKIKISVEILQQAAGWLRQQLKSSLTTKITPSLRFYYDDTTYEANRISCLINSVCTE